MDSDIPASSNQLSPCLLYHKVTSKWEAGVTWTPPDQFKRLMSAFHFDGWKTINPDSIFQCTTEPVSEKGKKFLLCFDDGYECTYTDAYPILERFDYKPMIFIPSGFIGKNNDWDHHLLGRHFNHLNLEQLKVLIRAGWVIGSHTVTHRALTNLSDLEIKHELSESKKQLEALFNIQVDWVSFPFGRYNKRILEIAREIGYKGAVVHILRHNCVIDDFILWSGDGVYRWDSNKLIHRRLYRKPGYRLGKLFRVCVNWFSGCTLVWKRLFSS
ncbi:MAG: polysaccharide deacetylase family protein [Calditrichaeota bacterium]|nr:polysaccharide deacetylase family protein [Calditrichota bacterium]